MYPIGILIFNTLAKHQGIHLPGIGSLMVAHTPAHLEKKTLFPSMNRVVFLQNENPQLRSIIELIGETYAKKEEKAIEIYQHWFEEARGNEVITIDSVGILENGKLTPSQELARTLNPAGSKPFQIPQRTPFWIKAVLWTLLLLLVGAGITYGVLRWMDYTPWEKWGIPCAVTTPDVKSPIHHPQGGNAQRPAAANAATWGADESIPIPSGSTACCSSGGEPIVSKGGEGEHYFVVLGAFNAKENAFKYIAKVAQTHPDLTLKIIHHSNGRYMVYCADMSSEAQAEKVRKEQEWNHPEVWVLKYRTPTRN